MGKLIALIVFVLMFLAGIILLAFGFGIGLLLLIVGILGSVMMGFLVGSRGAFTHVFTPRGFFDAFVKTKVEKPDQDQPVNIWDQVNSEKDKK